VEVEGRVQWIGRLVESDEQSALLAPEDGSAQVRIPITAVQLARVDVRFED
jgi:ribosome maturation factor RimP